MMVLLSVVILLVGRSMAPVIAVLVPDFMKLNMVVSICVLPIGIMRAVRVVVV